MSDINKLKERLKRIEVEKQSIQNKLVESSRKHLTTRKVLLGVLLLKLAESDADVHASLVKVWNTAKATRPNVFTDVVMPPAPPAPKAVV